MKNVHQKYISFFICMAITVFFMLFWCSRKEGTFVDELLSYDLSNRQSSRVEYIRSYLGSSSLSSIMEDINDILKNGKENSRIYKDFKASEKQKDDPSLWHDAGYFGQYLMTTQGDRFDFLSVFYNISYDSAPPLYYLLLHFICSLFPDTFSLWYGLIINVLFLLPVCALLYYLADKYFGGTKYAFLITLCYAMSIGGISTLLIIRMYAMYTFFVLAFFAINLRVAENGFTFTKRSRLAYIFCAFFGFYTQYYFVIYAFFLVGTILLYLSRKKETRPKAIPYLSASLTAAILSVILWPFSIKHIFFDSFGAGTFSNASSGHILHRLAAYFKIIATSLFAQQPLLLALLLLLSAAGILWLIYLIKTGKKPMPSSLSILKGLLILIPSAGYILLVAISTPFLANRYVMCIFPFIFLGMYGLFRIILSSLIPRSCPVHNNAPHCNAIYGNAIHTIAVHRYVLLCILGAAITLYSLMNVKVDYTYPEKKERAAFMKEAGDAVCIYVAEPNGWMYKSCLDIMGTCQKTALLYPEQINSLDPIPLPSGKYGSVLICISSSYQQEVILDAVISRCGLEGGEITVFPKVNDEYSIMYLWHPKTGQAGSA